jgi:hypothetical protein
MDILDSSLYSDLFWMFFSIISSILMLWISIVLRVQKSGASRALLAFAILDVPCSLLNSVYWYVWPMGFLMNSGADAFSDPGPLSHVDTVATNLSTLFYLAWMVTLLFVGFRFRLDQKRLQETQRILEQKING